VNFFPEIEPDRVRITPERSTAQGLELLLRGSRGSRVNWWLAWSWSRAEDRIAGRSVPRSLDQPHALALDLDFRLSRPWSLNLAWRYHTGWPTTPVSTMPTIPNGDPDDEPEAVFGALNSERLPAYHRLDLRASRRWDLRAGGLTFYVDVQNVYNRRNLAGLSAKLDESGGVAFEEERGASIFPSLGIAWEL
jgi:hypothetical protein